jgi:hypothetical protein
MPQPPAPVPTMAPFVASDRNIIIAQSVRIKVNYVLTGESFIDIVSADRSFTCMGIQPWLSGEDRAGLKFHRLTSALR